MKQIQIIVDVESIKLMLNLLKKEHDFHLAQVEDIERMIKRREKIEREIDSTDLLQAHDYHFSLMEKAVLLMNQLENKVHVI